MVFISSTRQGSKPQHRHRYRFLSLFLALGSWERWKKQDSEIKKGGFSFLWNLLAFPLVPTTGRELETESRDPFLESPGNFSGS